jgi:hypothetical protein
MNTSLFICLSATRYLARSQLESSNFIRPTSEPVVVGSCGYLENDYHPGELEVSITKSCVILTSCPAPYYHNVVVHPQSTENMSKIVKIVVRLEVPVAPHSGGTSLKENFHAVSALPASRDLN